MRTLRSHILGPRTSGTEGLVEPWSGLRSPARRSARRRRPPSSNWVWPRPMLKSWCCPSPRWGCSVARAGKLGFGPVFDRPVPDRSDQVDSGTGGDEKGLVGARMAHGRDPRGIAPRRRMVERADARVLVETPREAKKAERLRPQQHGPGVAIATEADRREEREDPARKAQVARTPRPPNKLVCQRRRKTTWLRA